MTEAASWAIASPTLSEDNAYARETPGSETENYVQPIGTGLATVRGNLANLPGKEPIAVWVLVVGGIVALILISKAFKTASA
jgi:hypothetical protein